MKILLTGATGSIGGAVLSALIENGHEVTCPIRSLSKVSNLTASALIHFIELDSSLDDYTKFNQLAQGFPCIIHTGFAMFAKDAEQETNITRGLLEAAKAQSAHEKITFIFTSEAHVIGPTDYLVSDDNVTTECCEDFCRYRVEHENLVLSYSNENFAASVVRPCWVYGGSFVDLWFSNCKKHGKIVVPERPGKITFIHKEDLGVIYRLVAENAGRGCYVASEGQGPEIDELIELNKRLTGVTVVERVQDVMPYVDDFSFTVIGLTLKCSVDSTRAKNEFGFEPNYNLMRDGERLLKID